MSQVGESRFGQAFGFGIGWAEFHSTKLFVPKLKRNCSNERRCTNSLPSSRITTLNFSEPQHDPLHPKPETSDNLLGESC